MKRQILILGCAAALALAGCATYHEETGGTSAETGTIYGSDDQSTSDFGRGETWRNTPNAQRERGYMEGPVGPTLPHEHITRDDRL
jgi:hypothetical protein